MPADVCWPLPLQQYDLCVKEMFDETLMWKKNQPTYCFLGCDFSKVVIFKQVCDMSLNIIVSFVSSLIVKMSNYMFADGQLNMLSV